MEMKQMERVLSLAKLAELLGMPSEAEITTVHFDAGRQRLHVLTREPVAQPAVAKTDAPKASK